MHVVLSLVAVFLGVGEETPKANAPNARPRPEARRVEGKSGRAEPTISYEVRFVTMSSLDWRGKLDPRLKPLARQGGTAVWASDAATFADLMTLAQADAGSNVLLAPKLTTPAGREVSAAHEEVISYVAHVDRVADGPVNKATKIAFKPEVEHFRDGVRVWLGSGRLVNQGFRTSVRIERDKLQSFLTTKYSEDIAEPEPAKAESSGRIASGVNRLVRGPQKINATIQVPVVDSARVDGEWVIPQNGALIISLGVSPKDAKGGRRNLWEELVVIGYHPTPGPTPNPPRTPPTTAARPAPRKGPAAN